MNVIKKSEAFAILLIFSCFLVNPLQADVVRLAAFDIGSAETKLTIADIDTETNKIVTIYFQGNTLVELRRDLAVNNDGKLSQQIEEELTSVLNDYKSSMGYLSPQEWFGIGTAVFRNAKNGQEVLDRITATTGISLYLATQIEEGEIGFNSAVAASGLDPSEVIAWDSGSGSFQITTMNADKLDMYGAEFGMVPALEVLVKIIRGTAFNPHLSPNPITTEEADLMSVVILQEKLPPIPDWLESTNKQIVAFGGSACIFSLGQIATGKDSYTQDELFDAIHNLTGNTDDQLSMFPEPPKAIIGLTLLYSVMKHCGIKQMNIQKTNGGCEGLLVSPRYWNIATDREVDCLLIKDDH